MITRRILVDVFSSVLRRGRRGIQLVRPPRLNIRGVTRTRFRHRIRTKARAFAESTRRAQKRAETEESCTTPATYIETATAMKTEDYDVEVRKSRRQEVCRNCVNREVSKGRVNFAIEACPLISRRPTSRCTRPSTARRRRRTSRTVAVARRRPRNVVVDRAVPAASDDEAMSARGFFPPPFLMPSCRSRSPRRRRSGSRSGRDRSGSRDRRRRRSPSPANFHTGARRGRGGRPDPAGAKPSRFVNQSINQSSADVWACSACPSTRPRGT